MLYLLYEKDAIAAFELTENSTHFNEKQLVNRNFKFKEKKSILLTADQVALVQNFVPSIVLKDIPLYFKKKIKVNNEKDMPIKLTPVHFFVRTENTELPSNNEFFQYIQNNIATIKTGLVDYSHP